MVLFKIRDNGGNEKLFLTYERLAEILSEFLDKNGIRYSAFRVSPHYDPILCLHFILDPDSLKALFYDSQSLMLKGYTEINGGVGIEIDG